MGGLAIEKGGRTGIIGGESVPTRDGKRAIRAAIFIAAAAVDSVGFRFQY